MKNKIFSFVLLLMKHILFIIVIVLVVYLLVTHTTSENFVNEGSNMVDPSAYEPGLINQINSSPFVGLPDSVSTPWAKNPNEYGKVDALDDGMNGNAGLNYNLCSKSCCSQQYPVPFSLGSDPLVCNSGEEYVSSSYMCNNGWQDSGCLCMTKEQALFLNKRGNNG